MSCAIKYKIIYINFHTSYESKERFHKVSQLYQDDFLGRIQTKKEKVTYALNTILHANWLYIKIERSNTNMMLVHTYKRMPYV